MFKKIAILCGIAALCIGTVYGLDSLRATESTEVPCNCCGPVCDCGDCKCDESCDDGGKSACTGDCSTNCCGK